MDTRNIISFGEVSEIQTLKFNGWPFNEYIHVLNRKSSYPK